MRLSWNRGLSALILLVTLGLAWCGVPEAAQRRINVYLRAGGTFDPQAAEPRVPADLDQRGVLSVKAATPSANALNRSLGHYIVQFDGPVREEWKAPILDLGGRIFHYLPDYAFVVRIAARQLPRLRRAAHVRSVRPFHPAYALSPLLPRPASRKVRVNIKTFSPEDIPGVSTSVRRLGGKLFAVSTGGNGMITADLASSAARTLARIFGVAWIEPTPYFARHSSQANFITGVEKARQEGNLYGTNQIIAIADTGLDTGDNSAVGIGVDSPNIHPDFRGRILRAQDMNLRGSFGETIWSDPNGHGTHVIGAMTGSGLLDSADPTNQFYNGRLSGAAPEANFIVQSILDDNGLMLGASEVQDLYFLFQAAYDEGARVHNNSWGTFSGRQPVNGQFDTIFSGEYLTQSQAVDRFTWDHPDMVIVFSAGNGAFDLMGQEGEPDGVINGGTQDQTIEVPATAKNCITVGATENHRPDIQVTYEQLMPFTLLGEPILSDRVANFRDGMAAFSARGFCSDAEGEANRESRVKPDLCAPGTYVLAARTSRTFVPLESFEGTDPGKLPTGWGNNGGIATVTDKDGFPNLPGRSAGFGNPSSSYPEPAVGSVNHRMILPEVADLRHADTLFISYRAKWNLRIGDTVEAQCGGNSDTTITGDSGGAWQYRLERIPLNGLRNTQIEFLLTATARGAGTFYFLVDDVRVYPGLDDTIGRLESEKAETDADRAYQFASGTSIAAAQISGMAALVRQFYQEALNHPSPSAALVKATLLASATDLQSLANQGQYPGKPEQPAARPNYVQGWGRADLQKALFPGTTALNKTRLLSADVAPGLGTGENDVYEVEVREGTPLNVALVWTDPPAAEASGVALVNNLDLELFSEGGSRLAWGNRIVLGSSVGDERNNVETIDLASPAPGKYKLRITGRNVPQGRQAYALVIYGDTVYSSNSKLKVSPSEIFCQTGRSYAFTALFNGRLASGVTWTVFGPGSIDQRGLYTAPASIGISTVSARYTPPGTSDTYISNSHVNIIPAVGGGPTLGHVEIAYDGVPGTLPVIQFGYGGPAAPGPPSPSWLSDNKPDDPGSFIGSELVRDFDLSGAGAARMPPSPANIWWVKVTNQGFGNAEIKDLYILHDGKRFSATGPPVVVEPEKTAYRYIDSSSAENLPEVYAYVEIFHERPADLTRIVVGSPGNATRPEWLSAVHAGSGAAPGLVRLFVDLTGAPAGSLPPDEKNSWFLQVEDTVGAKFGNIRKFHVHYNGARFDGRLLPIGIPDPSFQPGSFARAWIDYSPPTVAITSPLNNSTVGATMPIEVNAFDNAWVSHVEFYLDDRLVGTDHSAPYQLMSNSQFDTNIWHRLTARAFDGVGNSSEHSIQVRTQNPGVRPNVVGVLGQYSFNAVTRELTATMTFRNDSTTGTRAYRATLQRVTLWGTGLSITGERRLYMQPVNPPPLPLKIPGAIPGEIEAGGISTLTLKTTVPPEVTSIARWTATGYYYDAPSGGNRFNM